MLLYFSTKSENTHRFAQKLGLPVQRIPLSCHEASEMCINEPFVLLVPTYGGGYVKGAVPKPVVLLLNKEANRQHLKGVIASGNTNFGTAYCIAGNIIAQKCNVPFLYSFELLGTSEDVEKVREGVIQLWQKLGLPTMPRVAVDILPKHTLTGTCPALGGRGTASSL